MCKFFDEIGNKFLKSIIQISDDKNQRDDEINLFSCYDRPKPRNLHLLSSHVKCEPERFVAIEEEYFLVVLIMPKDL